MVQPIVITLIEADHVAANLLHVRRTPQFLIAWALLGIAGYLVVKAQAEFDLILIGGAGVMGAASGILLGSLLIWPILVPWRARRIFRQTKALHEPTELTWNDERLLFKATTWSATASWSDFTKYREGKDHYLLYPNDLSFRIVPKRSFADDASRDDFGRLMRQKITPA